MNWCKIEHGVPDRFWPDGSAEVLCKVKTEDGYFNHTVLRFDEDGCWWMYLPKLGPDFGGGWVGIGNMEVLEWAYIEDGDMSKVTIEGFVVREADGRLWLCEDKPTRANDGDYWWALNEFGLNKDLFPEVTWETEPKPCKITIEIGKKKHQKGFT